MPLIRRSWLPVFLVAMVTGFGCKPPQTENETDAGVDAGTTLPDGGNPNNGDGGNPIPDAGGPPTDGGWYAVSHPSLPQLTFHNGTVLKNIHLVSVTWSGFEFDSDAQAFGDGIVSSQWLRAVGSEYGVQSATHVKKVVLTQALPPSLTDADLSSLLAARIADGTLPSPATTTDLVFLVYIPPGVQLDASAVTHSGPLCGGYYGYHYFGTYNGTRFPYAISGDCDSQITSVTALASHEFIEAVTDSFNDGYYIDQPKTDDWYLYKSFESADLCQAMPDFSEFGYTLERSWSNAAVAENQTPCVPIPPGDVPYSDVSPASSQVQLVSAGSTVNVQITGWSVASRDAWPVVVTDWPLADFTTNPQISVSSMNNGDTATVTLTIPADAGIGQFGSAVVYSGSTQGRYWPITVETQ